MEKEIIKNSVFGAIHEQDPRDISLASFTPIIQIPDSYKTDLTGIPVWNQRQIGACVPHALMKVLQILHFKETKELIDLSPRFPYAETKAVDGIPEQGTNPRTVMGVYSKRGCATQNTLKNDTTLSYGKYIDLKLISREALVEALEIYKKLGGTYAFADLTEKGITQAIYANKAVACLMRVGNTYWVAPDGTITWDKDKILPIQRPKNIEGGHEIVLYGYERVGERCKIFFLNSWSDQWADNGTGWFWLDEHIDLINQVMVLTEVPQKLIEEARTVFKVNIAFRDRNAEVRRIQEWLIAHGYEIPDGATGYYGGQTCVAVYDFQRDHGIVGNFGLNFGPRCRAIINSIK